MKKFLLFICFLALIPIISATVTDILIGTDVNLMEHAYYEDVPNHDWACTISVMDENGIITNTKDINYVSETEDIFVIPITHITDYNELGIYTINCSCYNSVYDRWDYSCDEATGFRVKTSLVGDITTTILGRNETFPLIVLVLGIGILGFLFIIFRR